MGLTFFVQERACRKFASRVHVSISICASISVGSAHLLHRSPPFWQRDRSQGREGVDSLTDRLHFGTWKRRDRAKNCRKRRLASHSRKSLP